MTHFPCLVFFDSSSEHTFAEDLKKALQPYHEYECTGIKDEYVKREPVDESIDELRVEYEEECKDDYDSFEDYIKSGYGYEIHEGKLFRWTNPNAQWDWWKIGGRWSESILIESSGQFVNTWKAHRINWEAMKNEQATKHSQSWDKWAEIKAIEDDKEQRMTMAREFGPWDPAYGKWESKEKFIEVMTSRPPVQAFISDDGTWHEKGSVGWFGLTQDDNADNFTETFEAQLARIPAASKNLMVCLVDCHI